LNINLSLTITVPFATTAEVEPSPKVTLSARDAPVREENQFLSPDMCREHPESTSHMFSFLAQEAYIEPDGAEASVMGLEIKHLGIQY